MAEIATIVGIPLALIGLVFSTFALRDTARQVKLSIRQLTLAEEQSQPTFQFTPHIYREPNQPSTVLSPIHDRLILTMTGNAENIEADLYSAFVVNVSVTQGEITLDRLTIARIEDWWIKRLRR